MAKGTATCRCRSCGKEFTVTEIKRNRRDADSWEAWASRHYDECPDCYKARKAEERETARQEMAELAKSRAALTGTPKQVAWANTIREKYIAEVKKVYGDNEDTGKYIDWIVGAKTSASWWIDRRDKFVLNVVRETVDEFAAAVTAAENNRED